MNIKNYEYLFLFNIIIIIIHTLVVTQTQRLLQCCSQQSLRHHIELKVELSFQLSISAQNLFKIYSLLISH